MNNSTVNVSILETATNYTTQSTGILDSLNICVYIISFLFGLPTHSYVIWLIITGTGSGVASEFFILNLSVCEIGINLNCFVHAILYWSLSHLTLNFFVGFIITGRPLFQCLMCVERYLAVVHPVTFLKFKPLRYRVICSTVAWIICFGSCFVCMYILGEEDKHLYTWFFSLQSLLFFFIQLFCLVAVLRALKQSGPRDRKREEENRIKRRAFHLILITTASMAIIYGPSMVIGFLTIVIKRLIHPLWFIGLICYVLAGFVQPVLYLCRGIYAASDVASCICS